jgi:hypothetical protein
MFEAGKKEPVENKEKPLMSETQLAFKVPINDNLSTIFEWLQDFTDIGDDNQYKGMWIKEDFKNEIRKNMGK